MDNTRNILDIESGCVRLSISPQLKVSLREDSQCPSIPQENSQNCTLSLIPEDTFYPTDVTTLLEQKYSELSYLDMQSKIDLNDYSTNLNKLKSVFTLPSFKIVNNRTVNSTFDVLTGEFLSQKEDLIDVRFK